MVDWGLKRPWAAADIKSLITTDNMGAQTDLSASAVTASGPSSFKHRHKFGQLPQHSIVNYTILSLCSKSRPQLLKEGTSHMFLNVYIISKPLLMHD